MRWMRTCALVVAASTATAGCTVTRNQKVALGGAAATVAGTIVLATDTADTMPPMRGDTGINYTTAVGGGVLIGGLIVLFAAAAMEERLHEHRPTVIRIADRSRVDTQLRAQAWQLSKAAFIAARRGDCPHVQVLAQRIRELDSDMHETVFLRDAAVQKCVIPMEAEPEPPEPTEAADPDEAPPAEVLPPPSDYVPPSAPPGM